MSKTKYNVCVDIDKDASKKNIEKFLQILKYHDALMIMPKRSQS